jgi:hypothetical protein
MSLGWSTPTILDGAVKELRHRVAARVVTTKQIPEYQVWHSMLQRCYNKNNQAYHRYGGRGILVYEKWRESFWAFLEDVGLRPQSWLLIKEASQTDLPFDYGVSRSCIRDILSGTTWHERPEEGE